MLDPLEIYAPKRNESISPTLSPPNLELKREMAVYATNQQMYDENFVLLPLPMVPLFVRL